MGRYLNSTVPFETWKQIARTRFFVDKTQMMEDILNAVEVDGQRFLCITRPRRFGKSVMANMVAAFLGKAVESGGIFRNLAVMESEICKKHLNRHNVIFIDFSREPRGCGNYEQYINRIQSRRLHERNFRYGMMDIIQFPVKGYIILAQWCVHW